MRNTLNILALLVAEVQCKPRWSFRLDNDSETGSLCLVIRVQCEDSYTPGRPMTIDHWQPVPVTTYNTLTWRRWIFEQCRRVENHELGEWFRFGEHRPFAPLHGPGEDPYVVHEFRDPLDAITTQDGSLRAMPGAAK